MDILLVNVGNTRTTVARASSPRRVTVLGRMPGGYSGRPRQTAAAVDRWISRHRLGDAVLCSVVPDETRFWVKLLAKGFSRPPMVIGPDLDLGVALAYPRPRTTGADRLADVCGAFILHGAPVLAIDIGTAATFNMVRAGGRFVGGAIAPGPTMFTQYLADRTAQLPLVGLPSGRLPRVGRTTGESIRLSVGVGYRAMVMAIARHVMGPRSGRVKIVVTGGYARRLLGGAGGRLSIDPLLTLRGMVCAHLRNRCGSRKQTGRN